MNNIIKRKKTREVKITDNLSIGANAAISIQSMTNTDTKNVEKTVDQILRLEKAGCEIVRASIYDQDCAKAILKIKEKIHIPFVSDIHFDSELAIAAMQNGTDKLRINPGNIGSKAKIEKVVDFAKNLKIPIRIGVNGGSLKKEILQKYGGITPEALVESALEHVIILEKHCFENIVISIKASNVQTTVAATKLLSEKVDYPLHIGITEAGFGQDAIIKASVGLGALFLNGIGDTFRVSITGDPVAEIFAAKQILQASEIRKQGVEIVSCPTCARCGVDLESFAKKAKQTFLHIEQPITIAIMGCIVNGPGEALNADFGVAFSKNDFVVFERGEKISVGNIQQTDPIEFLAKIVNQQKR